MSIWYLCDLGAAFQERGSEKADLKILRSMRARDRCMPKDLLPTKTIDATYTVAICAVFKLQRMFAPSS
eukprot:scaffold31394_cov105-Skeletonema_dohrnii-CCMP3373.AAC.1